MDEFNYTTKDANFTDSTTVSPGVSEYLLSSRNSTDLLNNVDPIDEALLTHQLAFFPFYGVILPLLTVLGGVGNIICFFVFHHPEMRCLSTMFISAILISDTFYLIGVTVVMTPRSWLSHLMLHPDEESFWNILDLSQKLFIGMYPITEMAQCLVVWYTLALAIEQYCVFYHQQWLWKYSTRDKGLQIVTTIFIATILVHMVHFFKFVRHDVVYHTVFSDHKKICLSDIYRSKNFQTYEKFLYYIFFRAIPLIITIIVLPKVVSGGFRANLKTHCRLPDLKLSRVVKSGRSSKISITIIVIFVICSTVSNTMYGLAIKHMDFDQFMAKCHLTPSTRRFLEMPQTIEFLYIFSMVVYSSFKFVLCIVMSHEVRRLVMLCICCPRTNSDKLKEIMIYVVSNRSDNYET